MLNQKTDNAEKKGFFGVLKAAIKNPRATLRMLKIGAVSAAYALRLRFAGAKKSPKIFRNWMNLLTKTLGAKVNVIGTPQGGKGKPVMYLPNHVSYADALVLMGQLDTARITAAADIAKWPLIGQIAKRQNVTFITQARGSKLTDDEKKALVKKTCDDLQETLDAGTNVILFPEGTMSEGISVSRFSPGTFNLYFNEKGEPKDDVVTQPVVLEVKSVGGEPVEPGVSSPLREIYAQYCVREERVPVKDKKTGEVKMRKERIMNADIFTHVWRLAKQANKGGLELNIHFLEPVESKDYATYKDMAEATRALIEEKLQRKDAKPAVAPQAPSVSVGA